MRTHLPAHPRRIYTATFRTSFGLRRYSPSHLHRSASYAVLVHHGSVLPAASFRLRLAADALAVRLALPLVGRAGDLNPQVCAPCRAHIGWEAGLLPPSPHTTGRTVPYHGGWKATLVFRHRLGQSPAGRPIPSAGTRRRGRPHSCVRSPRSTTGRARYRHSTTPWPP